MNKKERFRVYVGLGVVSILPRHLREDCVRPETVATHVEVINASAVFIAFTALTCFVADTPTMAFPAPCKLRHLFTNGA